MGGVFSAHVTGNFVLFAAAIAQGIESHDYIKILTFPFFVLAVILGTLLYHKLHKSKGDTCYKSLLWAMTALLMIAAVLSFAQNDWLNITVTMIVVIALGIQNTIHHFLPGPMTTVMTGTVMNTTANLTEKYILRQTPMQQGKEAKALPGLWMIVSFLAGCVLAAIAAILFGLTALLLAALVMFTVMIFEREKGKA